MRVKINLCNLVNKSNLVHNFSWYLSLCMDDCLVCRVDFNPLCIPESHQHRVTNTKCRIDTVISPDDGHIFARNM